MAQNDAFSAPSSDSTAPSKRVAAVTKSDSTVVNCRFVYIGGAGDVAVIPVGQTDAVTFVGMAAGSYLWVECYKIMSTSTSATSMVACF